MVHSLQKCTGVSHLDRSSMTGRALLLLGLSFSLAGCADEISLVGSELGTRSSAIVNGSLDYGHPAVGILHSGGYSACTATLIGKHTVLTAAHCVAGDKAPYTLLSPVNFYLGGFEGTKVVASSVTVHPAYGGGNVSDLAVVHLAGEVTGIAPMPLATTAPSIGEAVELVGYGKTGEDSGEFGTKRHVDNTIAKVESQIFSVYGASGSVGNICNGDSGGPTFATVAGKETLIGIHSTKGGVCGQEGNDMRVDAFYGWIVGQAAGDLPSPNDTTPPQVKITAPQNQAELSTSFVVEVAASDANGIARVVLFVNGVKASEKTASPWRFQLQNLHTGTATLEAVAYDLAGRDASAAVQVRVTAGSADTGKVYGESCAAAGECESKLCAPAATGGICSKTCGAATDCPGGSSCVEHTCRPDVAGGAAFGAACTRPEECESGLCGLDTTTGQGFCTATCDLAAPQCPGSSTCLAAGQGGLCGAPAAGANAAAGELNGGCSVGAGAGADASWLIVLALGALAFGARRARRAR